MTQSKTLVLALVVLLSGACAKAPEGSTAAAESGATASQADSPASSTKKQDVPTVPNDNQNATAIKPPAADSVLYVIYKKDGDGATSYEVDFGSRVTYWYGHQFDFKGKHYFTGFAYKTAEKVGEEEKEAPEGKVAISQATFELTKPQDKAPWKLLETDGFVGEFGDNGKAVDIDDQRQPQTFETQDGRLLLAVPTSGFASGVATTGFALFVFDPSEVDKLRDQHWAYVGSIVAGEDNAAACDEGKVMPCVSSTGTLAFQAAKDGGGLPALHVAKSGTTIEAPGKTRALGAQDAATYAYDKEQNSYNP
ncbi:hypothetical protein [Luteimonas aquatica]|uniref:hypothetical protein n=1 Tax=Luteimonas aquatica TaxID=450364 RepID=UPI001F59FB84|nr:hypothetical protein [Luteimonas aquatica]